MTVTIKKNVDVQATLEAKQFKYQVKRDLSGAVQFENMASPNGAEATANNFGGGTDTATRTIASNNGWNFIKLPKVQLYLVALAVGSSPVSASGSAAAYWQINGVTKVSTGGSISCSSTGSSSCFAMDTITVTPAPVGITSAQVAPNILTNKAFASLITGTGVYYLIGATANDIVAGQKNQKVTIMK